MLTRTHFVAPLAVFVALIAAGCGQVNSAQGPKAFPASGKVIYKNKPLSNVVVTFYNAEGEERASATTNPIGEFTLTTYEPGDGAPAGEYTVSITTMEMEGEDAGEGGDEAAPAQRPRFPSKYTSTDTSDLRATVAEGEANNFTFELK